MPQGRWRGGALASLLILTISAAPSPASAAPSETMDCNSSLVGTSILPCGPNPVVRCAVENAALDICENRQYEVCGHDHYMTLSLCDDETTGLCLRGDIAPVENDCGGEGDSDSGGDDCPAYVPCFGSPPPPVPNPACDEYENDDGFGGTTVSCEYACRTGDTLGIYVESADNDPMTGGTAKVDGYTVCGGTSAECNVDEVEWRCAGISEKPASSAEHDRKCRGWSEEAIDSGVWVACYTVGVSTICQLISSVCEFSQVSASSLTAACMDSNESLRSIEAQVASAFEHLPNTAMSSFTVFSMQDSAGFVASVTPREVGGIHCSAASVGA